MTELNRRREYSSSGSCDGAKVEAGMFWYRCKRKHCTRAFSDKEKYLVHKKEDHRIIRILKEDFSDSNTKSRKDEQEDEIMTELPKASALSSRSSVPANKLAEDKGTQGQRDSQLHVSSEYGKLNDSHIASVTDDFTPEVIVLLEKSPEELLPLNLKPKVSHCVPSLDFVPTTDNHNQSTLETEIDEQQQPIQECVQVAIGYSDAELDSQGKICESENEPTNTAMHDENNVPSFPCPIRYNLRSRAVVIPALVTGTGTTDDKNKETGNCNDLQKVCGESLGSSMGDEMELEIKQPESQGNANEGTVVSDSEVIVAHIIRGSNGDDKISFRATFQSFQDQLQVNETSPLKMVLPNNEEDKLNAELSTDSRLSRNRTCTDDNESRFASVSDDDGNHTQDNNEDQYSVSEAVSMLIPGATLITQETEFSAPNSTTIPVKEKLTMSCSAGECSNTGFRLHLDLKEHIIEKHTAIRMTMIYKCMLCHLDFLSKEQLMQHLDLHCDSNKN